MRKLHHIWAWCIVIIRFWLYQGKAYELGQAVVMGMQGILVCWMRQSKHLENFKHKQVSENVKIKKNPCEYFNVNV